MIQSTLRNLRPGYFWVVMGTNSKSVPHRGFQCPAHPDPKSKFLQKHSVFSKRGLEYGVLKQNFNCGAKVPISRCVPPEQYPGSATFQFWVELEIPLKQKLPCSFGVCGLRKMFPSPTPTPQNFLHCTVLLQTVHKLWIPVAVCICGIVHGTQNCGKAFLVRQC